MREQSQARLNFAEPRGGNYDFIAVILNFSRHATERSEDWHL